MAVYRDTEDKMWSGQITKAFTAFKSNEFGLYMQPQYDQIDKKLSGALAVPMWLRCGKSVMNSQDFLLAAKEEGMSTVIDMLTIEQICTLLSKWERGCLAPFPVTAVVSKDTICNEDFPKNLYAAADKSSINRSLLHIAISEKTYFSSPEEVVAVSTDLKEAGFGIEVSDYSGCPEVIRNMPADTVRLSDEILTASTNVRGSIILSSVIRMAHRLGVCVVAQDVKKSQYSEYLKAMDCRFVQGSLFSEPIDIRKYEGILRSCIAKKESRDTFVPYPCAIQGTWLGRSVDDVAFFNLMGAAGVFEYDGTFFNALLVNDRFYQDTGIAHIQNVQVFDFLRYILPQYRNIFTEKITESKEGHCEVSCRLRIKSDEHKGDEWLNVFLNVFADTGGCILVFIHLENVTIHMTNMNRRLDVFDRLTKVSSFVPCVLIAVELGCAAKIVYYNDALPMYTGYTTEEIDREFVYNPINAFHIEDVARLHKEVVDAIISSGSFELQVRIKYKDGTYHYFHFSACIKSEGDGARYLYAALSNLDAAACLQSKYARQYESYKKRLEFLQSVFAELPCGILRYAWDGKTFSLAEVNESGWRILGFPSKMRFISYSHSLDKLKMIHPDDLEYTRKHIEHVLESGEESSFCTRIVCNDKKVKHITAFVKKLQDEKYGEIIQLVLYDVENNA